MAFTHLVGIDEVGRGPIAGPLCMGGCALLRERAAEFYRYMHGLRDSKRLTPANREQWASTLYMCAKKGICQLSLAFVSEQTIDERGLAYALRIAADTVLSSLSIVPSDSFVMLDGALKAPSIYRFQESIINGDEQEPLIAAASVIAKVRRDRHMVKLAAQYPNYGFEKHKGYGTKSHYRALSMLGPCELHRKSFLSECSKRAYTSDSFTL